MKMILNINRFNNFDACFDAYAFTLLGSHAPVPNASHIWFMYVMLLDRCGFCILEQNENKKKKTLLFYLEANTL